VLSWLVQLGAGSPRGRRTGSKCRHEIIVPSRRQAWTQAAPDSRFGSRCDQAAGDSRLCPPPLSVGTMMRS
jgi:hypothetical protein